MSESFMRHFKMPQKEIRKIRKDYEAAKDYLAERPIEDSNSTVYEQMAECVFSFFEELTGKKSNRAVVKANLFYWFDEGYEFQEMVDYIRSELNEPYYQNNPERFTIAGLFPIRDQERINIVWDKLQHFLSQRTELRSSGASGVMLKLRCGHSVPMNSYKNSPYCEECNEFELCKNWYSEFGETYGATLRGILNVPKPCGT